MRKISKDVYKRNAFNVGGGDVSSPPVTSIETPTETPSSNQTSSGNKIYKNDKDDYDYTSDDEIDMNKVEYITRNKELSYFDNGVQSTANSTDTMSVVDKMNSASTDSYEDLPPGYYDYIQYDHRKTVSNFINNSSDDESINKIFRIGDCYFIIPPEFVTVTTITSNDSIQALRQSGSIQVKHGYHQKEIQVKLVLNGMNQINGYEVESPFDYNYHVDGLRSLISQFKFTPFVPIENTLINLIHGVHAVALRNITVETIEGFPEALSLTITMQEFNTKAYTGIDECLFGDLIDWDLYRYYVQLPLCYGHRSYLSEIKTPTLTNDFEIKLLKEECLGGYKLDSKGNIVYDSSNNPVQVSKSETGYIENDILIDITNEIYYTNIITSNDNVKMTGLSFSMGNTIPSIQMSAHESPTNQYLGATDTIFSFSFETSDSGIAAMFNELNAKLQYLILNNKEKSGIGFIKINNELVNLTGTNFLLINSIVVSTVPGFPDLYSINLECVSYDSNQKENERLIALNPFENDRKGTKDDLITQEPSGLSNKIHQDAEIEKKLLEIELYPDLVLPTYKGVDYAIKKIREFRTKHNLNEQMSITRLPRAKCEIPGHAESIELVESGKYVDPDFYVMYPIQLTDLGPIGGIKKITTETADKENNSSENTTSNFRKLFPNFEANFNSIQNQSLNISKFSKSSIIDIFNNAEDNPLSIFQVLKPKPSKVIEPDYAYGYEPDQKPRISNTFLNNKSSSEDYTPIPQSSSGGGINSASTDPISVNKKFGNPFVDLVCDRADAKCGYVYGSDGQIFTSSLKSQYENRFGSSEYNGENDTTKWIGKQVFDCSGLICWALRKIGYKDSGFRIVSGSMGSLGSPVSFSEIKCGDVFYNGAHCGIYVGDGKTVEAMNSSIGVAYGNANSKYAFVRISGLKEACDRFLSTNKSFYSSSNKVYSSKGNLENLENTTYSLSSNSKSTVIQPKAPVQVSDDTGPGGILNNRVVLADFGNNNPCDKYNKEILKVATAYNFDPNFIKTIIRIESTGNAYAVSSYDSNILGLMQVYITYHKDRFKGTNYFDPEDNIQAGCSILADYGAAEWVNYDLEKLLCCYNAGPGYAQNVFVYGTKAMPSETTKYIEKYKKYYAELVSNGGKTGNRITPTVGGFKNPITGEVASSPDTTSAWEYQYDESDFRNPNAGKERNNNSYDIDVNLFGRSLLTHISDVNKDKCFSFSASDLAKSIKDQNKKNVAEYMYHDMVQYSHAGRLTRAFPGFLFMIMDEQADFIDEKKLWTNYYVYRSVIDINIHEAYDSPVHTAKVTLSNFHNNLSKIIRNISVRDLLDEGIVKTVYELTGAIVDEYISDKMLELKNTLKSELYLYEGARVHIRLGYGSNLSKYPTCFNGTITNIEHGELVTLIAQSDGVELVNQPITDKANQTNKDVDLPEETSNMVARMFTARENEFINQITLGKYKINSKNGIEHFGIFLNKSNPGFDVNVFDQAQFDIVQNIYKGTYKGIPFASPSFLMFDGETNWRFFASGKAVWDILKMCEKAMPEFVCYPKYFGFENRIYYGLPHWICNYKYEVDSSTGFLYTRGKAFCQMHMASSLYSIIDNNIKVDTRGLYTNFIGSYTIAGDISTTPVIMSDRKIDWSRQKTKTIDTTSAWDVKLMPNILEKFFEWSGKFDGGKELAIRVCMSELAISWKETYTGTLLMLGQPEISAYDSLYLDDNFLNMSGQLSVREVVHSMSISSGFTTSVVPGMIVFNKTQQSGMVNVYRSTKVLGCALSHYISTRFITAKIMKSMSLVFTTSRTMMYLNGAGYKVTSFLATKGRTLYKLIKSGKAVTQVAETGLALQAVSVGVEGGKLANITKNAIAIVTGTSASNPIGWVAIAIWIVVDFLIGFAITAIHDTFAYTNCIGIEPLTITMPDGTIKSYAGNVNGGVNLLPIGDTTE